MKHLFFTAVFILSRFSGICQITITAADMPVVGDTLRYSFASPTGSGISLADSGAGMAWNYTLTPVGQAVDTYQAALSVNLAYALVGLTAYGYKVADSFPIPIPIPLPGMPSIRNIYTFFEKRTGPSRYQAKAFAANIGGIPTPINYSIPDVWYFFPLDYLDFDTSDFRLNIGLPGLGSIEQAGVRRTRVDGWGTITTPFYTTPVNCIRVRSVISEVDSVQFGPLPAIGIPLNRVEYKWLVNGEHYPALWVTANLAPGGMETINSIRYRDNPSSVVVDNHVPVVKGGINVIKAYPNPAVNGMVNLEIPPGWKNFEVRIFDMGSKEVAVFSDQAELDLSSLPRGQYLGRITSGDNVGYVQLTR